MIKFPATLTPVPKLPGYFWDVEKHKMYSIKVGGVLRELKVQRQVGYFGYNRFSRVKFRELYYDLSHQGMSHRISVRELKKLEIVDYDVPVINLVIEKEKVLT